MRKSVSEKSNNDHEEKMEDTNEEVEEEPLQDAQGMFESEEVQEEGSQLERGDTVPPFHGFSTDEIPLKKIIPVEETLDDIFGES